ncbi:MAG: hypothetical protein JST50_19030 [Bacteroidetes bacterium]|jgi:hypothetical protein|nr:hypothetical protein [Bacteroidota bacterium]
MKLYKVPSILPEGKKDSEIKYFDNGNTVDVKYSCTDIEIMSTHKYPFFAFVDIRKKLEKLNITVMCNACRIDVYPSGSSTIGLMAYEMVIGLQATKLVNIFDVCDDLKLLASIALQKDFREKWLSSLQK